MDVKYCKLCDQNLLTSEFYESLNRGKPRLSSYCKPCTRKRVWENSQKSSTEEKSYKHRVWRENNPEAVEAYKLVKIANRWGLPLEDVQEVSKRTECDICGATQRLHVDHCHKSLRVRGLLCQNCNLGIGHFHDDIEKMKKAIEYLQQIQ